MVCCYGCSDDSPEGVRDKLVPAFLRGISSHHAGCLPAWKSLVERCFQKGLLKLVFATGGLQLLPTVPAVSLVNAVSCKASKFHSCIVRLVCRLVDSCVNMHACCFMRRHPCCWHQHASTHHSHQQPSPPHG